MISEEVAVENNVILETRKRKASDRANTDCRRSDAGGDTGVFVSRLRRRLLLRYAGLYGAGGQRRRSARGGCALAAPAAGKVIQMEGLHLGGNVRQEDSRCGDNKRVESDVLRASQDPRLHVASAR